MLPGLHLISLHMAVRHLELWSKYQFVCRCGRCNTSPQPYVDRVLNESASNLNTANLDSNHDFHDNEAPEEVANIVEEAVAEYMSSGDAKSCCCKLETLLAQGFRNQQFQQGLFQNKFRLHPLHYLSLNAYITLASAYNTRSRCIPSPELVQDYRLGALEMAMAAAAYSLLLAGATNHLLSIESSLIASASVFWINAGESILGVVKRLRWFASVEGRSELGCPPETEAQLGVDCCYSRHPKTQPREISGLTQEEFKMTCTAYLDCILEASSKVWPFLKHRIECLKEVKDPIDFSWLGKAETGDIFCSCRDYIFLCGVNPSVERRRNLFVLASHCLLYGGYLTNICYGPDCYSIAHTQNLLHGDENTSVL